MIADKDSPRNTLEKILAGAIRSDNMSIQTLVQKYNCLSNGGGDSIGKQNFLSLEMGSGSDGV